MLALFNRFTDELGWEKKVFDDQYVRQWIAKVWGREDQMNDARLSKKAIDYVRARAGSTPTGSLTSLTWSLSASAVARRNCILRE